MEYLKNRDEEVVYEHHQYEEEGNTGRVVEEEYVEVQEMDREELQEYREENLRDGRVGDQLLSASQPIRYIHDPKTAN